MSSNNAEEFKEWPQYGRLMNGVVVPCTMNQWALQIEDIGIRRVDSDYIEGAHVSTVFLGLNHGHGGPPLWFETMVFDLVAPNEPYAHAELQWRYETLAQAKDGHARACQWVREHIDNLRAQRRDELTSEVPEARAPRTPE